MGSLGFTRAQRRIGGALFAPLLLLCVSARAALPDALQVLASVGPEGQGNEKAGEAWKEVIGAGPAAIPVLLSFVGKGSSVADNWLRLAGNSVVDAALQAKQPLPIAEMAAFLSETTHSGPSRLVAFELLAQADPVFASGLQPGLLHDQVQELRRGAVQLLIDQATATKGDEQKVLYQQALEAVRDEDQTKTIAAALGKLGVQVDLPRHFGFLMKWHVIGPFDNTGHKGFETVFPPEQGVDLKASYPGKGKTVQWQPWESKDEYGKVDLNKPLGMLKEVTGYAVATVDSPVERDAEVRLGCKDAWKVWLNGRFIFGRDEYHRGQQIDQYKLPVRLKKGANLILVKCCQNEQKEEWTVEWEFQLRICDSAGTAILSADREAEAQPAAK